MPLQKIFSVAIKRMRLREWASSSHPKWDVPVAHLAFLLSPDMTTILFVRRAECKQAAMKASRSHDLLEHRNRPNVMHSDNESTAVDNQTDSDGECTISESGVTK